MGMPSSRLRLTSVCSIEREVVPFLQRRLKEKGYALVSYETKATAGELEKELLAIILLCGPAFASRAAYTILKSNDNAKCEPVHTESIYALSGVTPYFALGCVQAAENGGETRIFDARLAAHILRTTYLHISNAILRYTSVVYPGEMSEYPLIYSDPEYGDTLRYRAKTSGNAFTYIPTGYTEDNIYHIVDDVLNQCVAVKHSWTEGDILFVNNRITLHNRMPHTGLRVMLRVRFDDPKNTKLSY